MDNKHRGFAVLTIVMVLSIASIAYTTNMAYLQLMDNKVLSNYYTNSEAFINAESGINLVLNKLTSPINAHEMLSQLPFTYSTPDHLSLTYEVSVTSLTNNKLAISSTGYSSDKSALRIISLEVYYDVDFDLPNAPLLSNGRLSLNSTDTINDGCEGVPPDECLSPGNIADNIVTSQPDVSLNEQNLALCPDNKGVEEQAVYGELVDVEGASRIQEVKQQQWGNAASFSNAIFDQISPIDDIKNSRSLFESTFAVTWADAKQHFIESEQVAYIDMRYGNAMDCSHQLSQLEETISIIYIEGDCQISPLDVASSPLSGEQHFTVGSTESPKMVFMEGGTFIAPQDTQSTVIGMLYLLPDSETLIDSSDHLLSQDGLQQSSQQLNQQQAVNLSGITVNGALLSEYSCSYTQSLEGGNGLTSDDLSVRYDKQVLKTLYQKIAVLPSASHYQLVAGTWRDF